MSGSHTIVRLGLEGDRARRAAKALDAERRALEAAVRRTLPYLTRRKIKVEAHAPTPTHHTDAMPDLAPPVHVTRVRFGSARGALVLDGKAIAHGLDGVLGGAMGSVPELDAAGLSPAQTALAARLAAGLVEGFAAPFAELGVRLSAVPEDDPSPAGGLLVSCAVRIGEGATAGTIVVLVPAAVVAQADAAGAPAEDVQPRTAAALAQVEVDLVAELGRVRVPLARLATLREGDVLRLPIALDASARVRVSDRVVFRARPTTAGQQIAVAIERHGD